MFEQYSWPGNVRQLLKEVERLVALTTSGEVISLEKCSRELLSFNRLQKTAEEEEPSIRYAIDPQVRNLEVSLIKRAMKRTLGNKTKAADLLQITRQGLLKKIKRYGLERGEL